MSPFFPSSKPRIRRREASCGEILSIPVHSLEYLSSDSLARDSPKGNVGFSVIADKHRIDTGELPRTLEKQNSSDFVAVMACNCMGARNILIFVSSRNEHKGTKESTDYKELLLLSEIESNPELTQRQLSDRLGVALGLTNMLLRNLATKGHVRVIKATWKRRLYTLTPKGFSHRVTLMVTYVHRVLDNYRAVRQTLREQLEPLALNRESRVAIVGTSDFAELVYLGLKELGIEEMDFFATNADEDHKFLGASVHNTEDLQPGQYDHVVIALLAGWEKPLKELKARGVPDEDFVTFFADGVTRGRV